MGPGTFRTLVRIVVPLSPPGLGVAVLFGFLVAWNEFAHLPSSKTFLDQQSAQAALSAPYCTKPESELASTRPI